MGLLNLTPPTIGQPNATEDVDVVNAFSTIQTWANGNIDESNITTATLQRMALSGSGTTGRGASIIAATESRTNVAFGTLGTPDQVTVTLPTNGLIQVLFQATWQESVDGAAEAAIFLGGTGVKLAQSGVAAPVSPSTVCTGAAGIDTPLSTGPGGLMGFAGTAPTAYTGDVTTGQVIGNASFEAASGGGGTGVASALAPMGGACFIFAAAGTYAVSIQFRSSSGSVTAKNRKLWVRAEGY